ncbi:hypothetical protein INR49_030999 [Caranx melampygus]|nr:hypothetical protein INR49_030999 [Caranx melampygus]
MSAVDTKFETTNNENYCSARWSSSYAPAPVLTAAPVRGLVDEQIDIRGRFLPPHHPVTVCARMLSEDDDLWEAFAHYNTKADGTVISGSWGREGLRLRKKNMETPFVVRMSLLEGHVSPSEGQSTELAAVTTERWYMAPGPGPFPAMLDLWGMGGLLVEYRSALLASRGYASMSIAYIRHEELPGPQNRINVGASYFTTAFDLLRDHPQVYADRVGIIGLSFGVYLTLSIAIETDAKPSCLVCINGPVGSVVKYGGEGKAENFESEQKHWTYDDQGHVSFRDVSLPSNLPPESKVKIENLTCPLMYIVGEDDLSTSSMENANLIEESLRAAGKSHLFTRLSYPGAGHLIEPPFTPNSRVSLWSVKPKM